MTGGPFEESRAVDATEKVIRGFEDWLKSDRQKPLRLSFNDAVWRDLKNWLRTNVFYRRCAYCERLISGAKGDAEHYRPKGAVKRWDANSEDLVEPSCRIVDPVTEAEITMGHPGYFWLAYDWRNLVLACGLCNSGIGKNERFDIQNADYVVLLKLEDAEVAAMSEDIRPRPSKSWPGYYYPSPAELDGLEKPLLLNPLNCAGDRDPRKHLRFGVRGSVAAIDESVLGRACIEVFHLKDEELRVDRQSAQEDFQSKYFDAKRKLDPEHPEQSEAQKLLNDYKAGKYPFAAAVLDFNQILEGVRLR